MTLPCCTHECSYQTKKCYFLRQNHGDLAKAMFAIVQLDQRNPIAKRNDFTLLHFLESTVPTLVTRARAEDVPSDAVMDDYLQS
jgi:hypothetical protein